MERQKRNNIVISDYALHNLLPSQLKICQNFIRPCVDVSVEYLPKYAIVFVYMVWSIHEKLKHQIHNAQNRRQSEMKI